MVKSKLYSLFATIAGLFLSQPVYAESGSGESSFTSIGGVVDNIMALEQSAHSIIQFICVAAGVGLILSSLGLFYSHWQNPMNVPLSKPVSMFFLGCGLIILVVIPMYMHF